MMYPELIIRAHQACGSNAQAIVGHISQTLGTCEVWERWGPTLGDQVRDCLIGLSRIDDAVRLGGGRVPLERVHHLAPSAFWMEVPCCGDGAARVVEADSWAGLELV